MKRDKFVLYGEEKKNREGGLEIIKRAVFFNYGAGLKGAILLAFRSLTLLCEQSEKCHRGPTLDSRQKKKKNTLGVKMHRGNCAFIFLSLQKTFHVPPPPHPSTLPQRAC